MDEETKPVEEQASSAGEKQGKDVLLPASIVVAAVLIAGSIIYVLGDKSGGVQAPTTGGGKPPLNIEAIVPLGERDVILGSPDAPVTLIEYGDYQCPYCGFFFEEVEQTIRERYIEPGQAKMVYRNFAFLGSESVEAAEAAECAKDQGKFWVYHDALFVEEILDGVENNGNLNRELFMQIAVDLDLNVSEFASCFDEHRYQELIQSQYENAWSLGINSTPSNFVNSEPLIGLASSNPFLQFEQAIERALGN